MYSTLIVAKLREGSADSVADLFTRFDQSEMPGLMGTRRRELFLFRGLYFHLQDFDDSQGGDAIQEARTHPAFVKISNDLKEHIEAYDPETWRSPKDAMATRFYRWSAQ